MTNHALDIEGLTVAERLDLIDQLWESVSVAAPPLTPAQRKELDRRLDQLEQDGPSGLSLGEMWAHIEPKSR